MTTPDTDPPATVATIRDRMLAAGISRESIDAHHARRSIRFAGETVEDLDQPAPWPTPWTIGLA